MVFYGDVTKTNAENEISTNDDLIFYYINTEKLNSWIQNLNNG